MPLALITGAARANGIAAGIVPRLVADGWEVVTSDLTDVDYPCDLSTPTGPQELIDAVIRDRGAITALVLSHAHDVETGILDTTAESFDRHVAVNARASLLLIAAFARQVPAGGGAIVALTSDHTTGNLPTAPRRGRSTASSISAARELGRAGISANVVNPGPVDTGWMDDETRDGPRPRASPSAASARPRTSPECRVPRVRGRAWVSGQLLQTDGGFSARY